LNKWRFIVWSIDFWLVNLVPRAFSFRGWVVSEKGPGFGWSVLLPDWSMILNVSNEYMWE
jgi:hypothetical protein